MVLRKLFGCIFTAASLLLVTTAATALDISNPYTKQTDYGVYVQIDPGASVVSWGDYGPLAIAVPPYVVTRNERAGFSLGFDGGYQFNRFFTVELGGFLLPIVRAHRGDRTVETTIDSTFLYGAVKLMAPVYSYVCGFFKVGDAYRVLRVRIPNEESLNAYYWAPVLAVGVQFFVSDALSLSFQYLRMPGYNEVVPSVNGAGTIMLVRRFNAPAVNVVSVSLGYKLVI